MSHDLIIKNGTIIDGTGKDRFAADVAITGGKIAAVGRDLGAAKEERLGAAGLRRFGGQQHVPWELPIDSRKLSSEQSMGGFTLS